MQKIFQLFFWTVIFNSLATATWAQSYSSCYMLDADGNSLDLDYLCQNNSSRTSRSSKDVLDQTQFRGQPGVQIVPIKSRRSGIPVIDVKFNDQYTFEMMLDTGASSVVITEKMAKILGINHSETVWVSTPSSNYFQMPAGYVYSVGIGKLIQKNTQVITSPSMDMGLLGQSFFSQYDVTIKSDVVEFRER
ncbi:MAG: TIGR02281 family clan AA aspartic protease [Pleurocapsa sp.]